MRKASRKRLTCLSMMTGEKPRTRRAPGSTLGSGRQRGLRTPQEGSFSYPHSITSPHLNDVGFPCQEGLPGAAPTQDLDKVSMQESDGRHATLSHKEAPQVWASVHLAGLSPRMWSGLAEAWPGSTHLEGSSR